VATYLPNRRIIGVRETADHLEVRIVANWVPSLSQVGEQVRAWEALGVSSLVLTAGAVPFALGAEDDVVLLADACRL